MKRQILIISILVFFMATGFAMAEERVLNESPFTTWKFSPEVGTKLGYNIDSQGYGLQGTAKLGLVSEIHPEGTQSFEGTDVQGAYGKIEIKDLEIKVDTGDKYSGYTGTSDVLITTADGSTKLVTYEDELDYFARNADRTSSLKISWGDIAGTIYAGPIYVQLSTAAAGHGEVRYLSSIADDSLAITNIEYSIIPPYYTGARKGIRPVYTRDSNGNVTNPTPSNGAVSDLGAEAIKNEFVEQNSSAQKGAIKAGFKNDKLDVALGFSTKYDYLAQAKDTTGNMYNYNPFDVSLAVSITPSSIINFGFTVDAVSGNNNSNIDVMAGFLSEGNPLTTGLEANVALPMGENQVRVGIAAEVQFENKSKIAKSTLAANGMSTLGFDPTAYNNDKNTDILTMPYEVGLGLTYSWASKGLDNKETDAFGFDEADLNVRDGISLGFVYGVAPYTNLRELMSPYVGVQIGLWDSEDDGKPGMLPGLKTGLLINANYALGGATDIKSLANGNSAIYTYSKYEYNYESRMDVGLGFEAKYSALATVDPYFGALLKWYNLTDAAATTTQVAKLTLPDGTPGELNQTTTFSNNYINKEDLRMKLGFDIKNVIKNTKINVEWISGDLLTTADAKTPSGILYNEYDGPYGSEDYYSNQSGASSYSDAIAGTVTLGATISF